MPGEIIVIFRPFSIPPGNATPASRRLGESHPPIPMKDFRHGRFFQGIPKNGKPLVKDFLIHLIANGLTF